MIRASRRLPGLPGLISELPGGEPGRPSPPPGRAFPAPGRLLPGPSRRLPGPGSAFLAGERSCPWNPSDFCSSSAAHPPRAPDELKKSLGFRGQRVEEPDKWFQRGESGKAFPAGKRPASDPEGLPGGLRVASRPGRPCGSLAGRLRVACGSLRVASRRREGPPRPDRGAPPGRNREGRPGSSLSKREGGEATGKPGSFSRAVGSFLGRVCLGGLLQDVWLGWARALSSRGWSQR